MEDNRATTPRVPLSPHAHMSILQNAYTHRLRAGSPWANWGFTPGIFAPASLRSRQEGDLLILLLLLYQWWFLRWDFFWLARRGNW
ncbi:uncharacterized protein BDW47DRAFT_106470 [Aspergillus candidus]|uniref:Uncharacterized protein n=1 Tax=Aspergillus candidus TaxID=41067 RepID=A0A2I2FAE3_ASPCN|nr:hypothetical protein BDW47DRAFT_106470 [Aspergillus candidus]PLB37595.1 hypothetical protein BDW47DRAFT_106470 [Aspergillus candidus]